MSDYTLRRTGLSDDPHEEDWQAFYKGIPVGRIYRMTGSPARYRWSIYVNDKVQPGDDVQLMGYEDSLDTATGKFQGEL